MHLAANSAKGAFIVFVALLAGCSTRSQSSFPLPDSLNASGFVAHHPGPTSESMLEGRLTPLKLLKLQVAGTLPGPTTHQALEQMLRELQNHSRPFLHMRNETAQVSAWVSNMGFNYLLGQNVNLTETVAEIDVQTDGCVNPVTVKIDHKKNIWTACEINASSTGSSVQEYSPSGSPAGTYSWTGQCTNPSGCVYTNGEGFDSAETSKSVFAAVSVQYQEYCNGSCVFLQSSGFERWPAGSPSTKPTFISAGTFCSPICYVDYMDADKTGNLWFTFQGYDGNASGYGLAEVANAESQSPTVSVIVPAGTYGTAGGVYVSNGGTVLNVVDQSTRDVYQYHLPMGSSPAPFNTLGPTPQNLFGHGVPSSGGFNKGDTKAVYGDYEGWIDATTVNTNAWKLDANPNFQSGLSGAAYTPSDK